MLSAVGHPTVVNPDRGLRKAASSNGWPVLQFTRPVALRSRVTFPPARQTLAALAVGGAVAFGRYVGQRAPTTPGLMCRAQVPKVNP